MSFSPLSKLGIIQNQNYITNSDFNSSPFASNATLGWSLKNGGTPDANTKLPTSAPSAAAAGTLTLTAVTGGSQINGTVSASLSSTAATTAGDMMITDALTLDLKAQSTVQTFSFSYKVSANGTGTPNFSGTSANSVAVAIYDVTNSAWIQPAGVFNLVQSSGVGQASGTFQVPSNCTSVRLAVYFPNSTAASAGSPFTVIFDDFVLGPKPSIQGPSGPVGEIIAHGSTTPPVGFLYCDGTAVSRTTYSDLFKSIGTTYGVGDGSTTFNLPNLKGVFARGAGSQTISGVTYSGTLGSSQADQMQGHKHYGPIGVTGGAAANPGANINAQYTSGGTGSTQWDGTGNNSYFTDSTNSPGRGPSIGSETRPANVAVAYHIRYLATYQMSQDTDTRVVALTVSKTTTQSITNAGGAQVVVSWASATNDTHASFNSTTGEYTVPVSGFYRVSGNINFASNSTSGRFVFIQLDGVRQYLVGIPAVPSPYDTRVPFAGDFYCNAGQKIRIAVDQTSGVALNIAANPDTSETRLSISRISGPATIAASETVACRFTDISGASFAGADTLFKYQTKDYDTHSAYSTTTGLYTIPVSGKYLIESFVTTASVTLTTGQALAINVYKNGSFFCELGNTKGNGSTSAYRVGGVDQINLLAGDTISFYVNTAGVATSGNTAAGQNRFSIVRVGN